MQRAICSAEPVSFPPRILGGAAAADGGGGGVGHAEGGNTNDDDDDDRARDLVRRLLRVSASQRAGCRRDGALEVKAHPWFAFGGERDGVRGEGACGEGDHPGATSGGRDDGGARWWDALEGRVCAVPWVPDLEGPEDTFFFVGGDDDVGSGGAGGEGEGGHARGRGDPFLVPEKGRDGASYSGGRVAWEEW